MDDVQSRPLDRVIGPVLDLTSGVCDLVAEETAALDDPDEQAILIACQLLFETQHARTTQHTAQMTRLQAFFEASPDAVIIIDGRNHVQRWNSAATQLLGWEARETRDTPLEALLPALRLHLDEHTPGRGIELTQGGRTLSVDVTLARWREGAQWFRAITLRDQTARVHQELQQRHDQKLQQIGQLAAGIAHEISTPMQAVSDNLHFLDLVFRGLVDVLEAARQEPAPTSRLQAALGRVNLDLVTTEVPPAMSQAREALDHIARIVRAMKGFSHKGRGEPTPVDLGSAVETAVQLAQSEWRHVARVHQQVDPELPPVIGWADEIKQVVLNLVVNAAHAIEQGPRVPGTIWIRAVAEPNAILLTVQDNGCGMGEDVRTRVFDPFFTTKDVGKGSGQGLSIAKGIVERHGGEIRADSEVGVGTRFTVHLPRRDLTA